MFVIQFPLAGPRSLNVDFFKVFFHGKVVTNGVLPSRVAFAVERKVLLDPLIYITHSEPLDWGSVDCEGRETSI